MQGGGEEMGLVVCFGEMLLTVSYRGWGRGVLWFEVCVCVCVCECECVLCVHM